FRAFCTWENPLPADGLLRLFDLRGLLQMQMPLGAGSTEASFDVMSLTPGTYLVVIEGGQTLLLKPLTVMPPWGLEFGKQ
ncbi:MAG TPA: hypothetical protein PKD78_03080, partial [Saprospiraceae bacterium]|nr:hypothetical protein [Saprospiraceae bacterium]